MFKILKSVKESNHQSSKGQWQDWEKNVLAMSKTTLT